MLSFKPTFSLSSFTFTKRLFSSPLSAIRVVSSAYLRFLIFLPAIDSSWCVLLFPAQHYSTWTPNLKRRQIRGAKMKNVKAAQEKEFDFLSHPYTLESNWASRVTLQSSYVNTHTPTP